MVGTEENIKIEGTFRFYKNLFHPIVFRQNNKMCAFISSKKMKKLNYIFENKMKLPLRAEKHKKMILIFWIETWNSKTPIKHHKKSSATCGKFIFWPDAGETCSSRICLFI